MNKYNGDNLKNSIKKIENLAHQAIMELHEVESENSKLKNRMEDLEARRSEKNSTSIQYDLKVLEGRTVTRVGSIYDGFEMSHFFECEDGTRVADKNRFNRIGIKKMIETNFFTKEEIEAEKRRKQQEKEAMEHERMERNKRELERLKKELGE